MQAFFRKSRTVQLSIPEPCSQSWGEMTPVAGGRHCSACSATVTDFTAMTDRELFQWFKSGRTTCGQFYEDQLERSIAAPREPKHSCWMKLGLGLMAFVGFAKEGKAQDKKVTPVVVVPSPLAEESTSISAPETGHAEIKGTITDDKGEGIPGASITLRDSAGNMLAVTGTDINGEYVLSPNVKDSLVMKILINSVGFPSVTITGISVFKDKSTTVNHRIRKDLFRLRGAVRIIRGGDRSFFDPRGVYTRHTMRDWE